MLSEGFEAFLTVDQNLPFQHNVAASGVAVVVVVARTNRSRRLREHVTLEPSQRGCAGRIPGRRLFDGTAASLHSAVSIQHLVGQRDELRRRWVQHLGDERFERDDHRDWRAATRLRKHPERVRRCDQTARARRAGAAANGLHGENRQQGARVSV